MKIFKILKQRFKRKSENPFVFCANVQDSEFYSAKINDLRNGNIKNINMAFRYGKVFINIFSTSEYQEKNIKVSFFHVNERGCSDIFFDYFLSDKETPAKLDDMINHIIKLRKQHLDGVIKELTRDQYFRIVHRSVG